MPFVTITDAPSAHTAALLKKRGTDTGVSVEWEVERETRLTADEIQALRRKHGTHNVNLQRADDVKRLMAEGLRCKEIKMRLRNKYGARMIEADHATLSRMGEGFKGRKKTAMR